MASSSLGEEEGGAAVTHQLVDREREDRGVSPCSLQHRDTVQLNIYTLHFTFTADIGYMTSLIAVDISRHARQGDTVLNIYFFFTQHGKPGVWSASAAAARSQVWIFIIDVSPHESVSRLTMTRQAASAPPPASLATPVFLAPAQPPCSASRLWYGSSWWPHAPAPPSPW